MFRKKTPSVAGDEDNRRRRGSYRVAPRTQPYSYYNNRTAAQTTQPGLSSRLRAGTETPKMSWYRKKSIRLWASIVITGVVVLELTFLSSNGRVTVIDSSGNLDRDVDVVAYEKTFDDLLGSNILNRNKLTVDTNGIALKMQSAHPELESVTVITPLIGIRPSLYIHVSEPVFTLKQDASSYVLSAAGYITGRGVASSLPTVIDETGEEVRVAKQLLPSSHVAFMQTVWYQLTQQGIQVDSLALPRGKAFEVDVRLKEKTYYLKFNVTEDAARQSGAAVAVMKQLGNGTPKEYIDVRVPGKAYYK